MKGPEQGLSVPFSTHAQLSPLSQSAAALHCGRPSPSLKSHPGNDRQNRTRPQRFSSPLSAFVRKWSRGLKLMAESGVEVPTQCSWPPALLGLWKYCLSAPYPAPQSSPWLPLAQFHSEPSVKIIWRETSLVVQRLRICLAGPCRVRSSPGQGTKIPHAVGLLSHQGACIRRPRSHVLQLRPNADK